MKKETRESVPILRALLFLPVVLLALSSSVFSAPIDNWQQSVGMALLIPTFLIALAYMVIHFFNLENFKQPLYDEIVNLVISVALAVIIISMLGQFQALSGSLICASSQLLPGGCSSPVPDTAVWKNREYYFPFCSSLEFDTEQLVKCDGATYSNPMAWAGTVIRDQTRLVKEQLLYATEFNAKIGTASSVSGFCNMIGVGIGIAGCSSYGVLRGSVSQMVMAFATGLMELNAMQLLLDFSAKYALTLILPLGLILRSLTFSRKAGATLIAIALSFYIILPFSILLSQSVVDQFLTTTYSPGQGILDTRPFAYLAYPGPPFPSIKLPSDFDSGKPEDYECNPFEPSENNLVSKIRGTLRDSSGTGQEFVGLDSGETQSAAYRAIFLAIVRTLLSGALALTITITFVRALGKALGAEIDVWAIARLS